MHRCYLMAVIIYRFIFPSIHTFVRMILLFTVITAADLLSDKLQLRAIQWSQVWVKNLINAALIPIGLGYNAVYILRVALVVAAAGIGAGVLGHYVGLYFIETALSAGSCATNMGAKR